MEWIMRLETEKRKMNESDYMALGKIVDLSLLSKLSNTKCS